MTNERFNPGFFYFSQYAAAIFCTALVFSPVVAFFYAAANAVHQ